MIPPAEALLNVAPSPEGRTRDASPPEDRLSGLGVDVARWLDDSGDVNERDMECRLRVFDAAAKLVFSPFSIPYRNIGHIQLFLLGNEVLFSRKLSSASTVDDSFVHAILIEFGHMLYILTLNVLHCQRTERHYHR
jgi:hypothetical protein